MARFKPDEKPTGRRAMADYLATHTMYVHDVPTFSHNIKLTRLIHHIPRDHQDAAWELVDNPMWGDIMSQHMETFRTETEGRYGIVNTGRSGGHLVLVEGRWSGLNTSPDNVLELAAERLKRVIYCELNGWEAGLNTAVQLRESHIKAHLTNYDNQQLADIANVIVKPDLTDYQRLIRIEQIMNGWGNKRHAIRNTEQLNTINHYKTTYSKPSQPNPFLAWHLADLRVWTEIVYKFDEAVEALWQDFLVQCEVGEQE